MKKLQLIFTLSIFLQPFSFSQEYGWTKINTDIIPGIIDFTDVFFVSENEGWITTNTTNNIFKTNDGGFSFITQTTQYGTQAVCAFDTTYAYAGGLNGRIYYTSDGGLNWPAIGSIGVTLSDLDFPSTSQGYASGSSGTVYSIAGTSVTNLNCPSASTLRGISAPSVDHVWATGGNRIYYYNGVDFTSQIAPAGTFNDIHFIDNQKGWVVGDAGVIGYTVDGGASWTTQTNPDPQDRTLFGVFFYNEDDGWAVGPDGLILHTTDGGTNWAIVGEGLTTEVLSSIHFTSPTNGYVAGGNKTLLKYGEVSGIVEDGLEELIFEVHPNPCLDKLQIKSSKIQNNLKLEIIDLFGNVILEEEKGRRGKGEIGCDVSELPAGIYFVRIYLEDQMIVKKVIKL